MRYVGFHSWNLFSRKGGRQPKVWHFYISFRFAQWTAAAPVRIPVTKADSLFGIFPIFFGFLPLRRCDREA